MKAFKCNMAALQETHTSALQRNFNGDAGKFLQFMCRNVWEKSLLDGGKSYLAFGPYWWAVKDIIERTIGSQWGETRASNPIMRKVFAIRGKDHSDGLTLLLADEYRHARLAEFGVSPHHDLDGESAGDDEYTLEDGDMLKFVFS